MPDSLLRHTSFGSFCLPVVYCRLGSHALPRYSIQYSLLDGFSRIGGINCFPFQCDTSSLMPGLEASNDLCFNVVRNASLKLRPFGLTCIHFTATSYFVSGSMEARQYVEDANWLCTLWQDEDLRVIHKEGSVGTTFRPMSVYKNSSSNRHCLYLWRLLKMDGIQRRISFMKYCGSHFVGGCLAGTSIESTNLEWLRDCAG